LFTDQLPDATAPSQYASVYAEGQNTDIPDYIQAQIDRIVATFANRRQNGRFLDVGFGAGCYLQAAKEQGWTTFGTEVSASAFHHAQSRSLGQLHQGYLADAAYPNCHFDVIVASEVVEHVPDPLAFVSEIYRILRPGGLFWATTPHGCGLSIRTIGMDSSLVSPPDHLQLFSVKGIKSLLLQAGFSQVAVATHGFYVTEVLHHFRSRHRQSTASTPPPVDSHDNFDRLATSRSLNEKLMRSPWRRAVKSALNGTLNVLSLGDSLKIHAIK
jgi:2-polyprenyl-3-methyl-5-hydroxy-6-metoxy-1,4-benzoquinol methylase